MFLLFLALIVFACMKRRAWSGQATWSRDLRHPHHRDPDEPSVTAEERFHEWHRRVHGREHGEDDTERV